VHFGGYHNRAAVQREANLFKEEKHIECLLTDSLWDDLYVITTMGVFMKPIG